MNIFSTFMTAAGNTAGKGGSTGMIIMMVALFAAMYFFTIRPNKKQQQKEQELRDNTQVGDEIVTIGGVCGKVVAVKDDSITIETGADRTKIKFVKQAIRTNVTADEKLKAERDAAKAAAQSNKAKKAKKKDDVDDRPKSDD